MLECAEDCAGIDPDYAMDYLLQAMFELTAATDFLARGFAVASSWRGLADGAATATEGTGE